MPKPQIPPIDSIKEIKAGITSVLETLSSISNIPSSLDLYLNNNATDLNEQNSKQGTELIFPIANKKNITLRRMLKIMLAKRKGRIFVLARCIKPSLKEKEFKISKLTWKVEVTYRVRRLRKIVQKYNWKIELKNDQFIFINPYASSKSDLASKNT